MSNESEVPSWLVWVAGTLGVAGTWLFNALKPFWEKSQTKKDQAEAARISRENAEMERLQRAAESAFAQRDGIIQGQLNELRAQLKQKDEDYDQVRAMHDECRQETANLGVFIERLKTKLEVQEQLLRANSERLEGLSNENAALRKLAVRIERNAGISEQ